MSINTQSTKSQELNKPEAQWFSLCINYLKPAFFFSKTQQGSTLLLQKPMGSTLLVSLWAQSLVLCPIEQIMKSTLQITVIRVRTEEYPLNADMGRKKNKEKKKTIGQLKKNYKFYTRFALNLII